MIKSPLVNTKVDGLVKSRIDLLYNYLLDKSDDICQVLEWGADQYGRWISAVSTLAKYKGENPAKLRDTFKKILSFQKDDGRLLIDRLDDATWHGAAMGIMGLLDYYNFSKDENALKSAIRLVDFCIKNYPLEERIITKILCGYPIILGQLVRLYEIAKDREYLKIAKSISKCIDFSVSAPGDVKLCHPKPGEIRPGVTFQDHCHHTHSYLNIMHSILDLYSNIDDEILMLKAGRLERVIGIHKDIVAHTMWASGGIPEHFGEYFEHNDETCSVVDWIIFNLKLYRETGDVAYLDISEHSFFNHFLFNQDYTGSFYAERSISSTVKVSPNDGELADICCTMHAALAMREMTKYVYSHDDGGVDINFFIPSETEIPWKEKNSIKLHTADDVMLNNIMHYELSLHIPEEFEVRVRIPLWCIKDPAVRIDGKDTIYKKEKGFAILNRIWQPKDKIDIIFHPSTGFLEKGGNGFNRQRVYEVKEGQVYNDAVLFYGPILFMVDRMRNNNIDIDKITLMIHAEEKDRIDIGKPIITSNAGRFNMPSVTFEVSIEGNRRIILTPMYELTNHKIDLEYPFRVRNDWFVK